MIVVEPIVANVRIRRKVSVVGILKARGKRKSFVTYDSAMVYLLNGVIGYGHCARTTHQIAIWKERDAVTPASTGFVPVVGNVVADGKRQRVGKAESLRIVTWSSTLGSVSSNVPLEESAVVDIKRISTDLIDRLDITRTKHYVISNCRICANHQADCWSNVEVVLKATTWPVLGCSSTLSITNGI